MPQLLGQHEEQLPEIQHGGSHNALKISHSKKEAADLSLLALYRTLVSHTCTRVAPDTCLLQEDITCV